MTKAFQPSKMWWRSVCRKGSLFLIILLLGFIAPELRAAVGVHGRITVGTFAAVERFSQFTDGTNRNDVATASSRLFLKLTKLGGGRFEIVTDLRDKHDFFEKLDRQRLELTDQNTFQVYQLSAKYPGKALFGTLGRFVISEAGNVFVDGGELGGFLSSSLRLAAFGGLNPRRTDQSSNQYNPESNVFGGYVTYEPKDQAWNRNIYLTQGIVNQLYKNNLDRNFLFHNSLFQWGPENRLLVLAYWDFVPRSTLQSGSANVQQALGRGWVGSVGYSAVDVIEYFRRQGVLERLDPSPYREGSVKLRYSFSPEITMNLLGAEGQREKDGFRRAESQLGFYFSHVFGRRWDAYCHARTVRNFTSQDTWGKVGGGYFSRQWEVTLDFDGGVQSYDRGTTLHPIIGELSVANYLGDDLYAVLALQDARDERLQITSAFFKVNYRFGNQGLAPVRDGSPPRGRL